jgi:PAS domain S-box-containing protein
MSGDIAFQDAKPGQPPRRLRGRLRGVYPAGFGRAAGAGLLYFLAARLAIPLTTPEGVAQFWPAAGIAVGALIVLGNSARLPIAAAVAAASLAANGLAGRSVYASIAFALANSGEVLFVAALVDRWFPRPFELDHLKGVLGLFGAAAAGTAIWQAASAVFLEWARHTTAPFPEVWGGLVWANITGIVLVVPFLLGLAAAVRNPPSRRELLEGLAVLLLQALASAHAFALLPLGLGHWMLLAPFTSQLPLLLWLAVRCGPLFAAAGSLVLGLSILASFEIERGRFADAAFPFAERLLATDFAMLASAFAALAIAALIAERKSAEQLRLFVEQAPVALAMFDRDMCYLAASQRYRMDHGFTHCCLTGRTAFEVYPDMPEAWREVMRRAFSGEVLGGDQDQIVDKGGRPQWLRWEARPWREAGGGIGGILIFTEDVTARVEAGRALRESEERLRLSNEAAGIGTFTIDPQSGCVHYSPQLAAMLGFPGVTVTKIEDAFARVHREDLTRARAQLEAGLNGAEEGQIKAEFRFVRPGGEIRWMTWAGRVHFREGASGRIPFRIDGACVDITARKRHEDQIQLLMREVNHRSKNMLTLVQAVARQTIASSPDDFLNRFEKRVQALAASQDLLVRNEWKGVDLDELIRSQLAHFADLIGTRIVVTGRPLFVSASAAQSIGMALHELATNAGKYGALSGKGGQVRIAWGVERPGGEEASFCLGWHEQGGPAVTVPSQTGFGSIVTTEIAEMSLNAKVILKFEKAGIIWKLRCAASEVIGSH